MKSRFFDYRLLILVVLAVATSLFDFESFSGANGSGYALGIGISPVLLFAGVVILIMGTLWYYKSRHK